MRRINRSIITLLIAATLIAGAVPCALATPSSSSDTDSPASDIESARVRALELEAEIEELRGSRIALEGRIDVTNQRIFQQQEVLAAARETLTEARAAYNDRLVRIYKTRIIDPISLLLNARSISDLYARAMMLSRISARDKASYDDASIATHEAEYQATVLDDLKRQDVELRQIQTISVRQLNEALVEQNALIDKLTEEARTELVAVQTSNKLTRKEWTDSSIPIGASIETTGAVIEQYPDRTYLVPVHQPKRYRSIGQPQTLVCSWYGPGFNGRQTASGQTFNEEDLTCASRTLPFGTRIALSRGSLRIIVVVNDRGPFIAGRDLDLSKAAARRLGFSGVEPVTAEFVEAIQ